MTANDAVVAMELPGQITCKLHVKVEKHLPGRTTADTRDFAHLPEEGYTVFSTKVRTYVDMISTAYAHQKSTPVAALELVIPDELQVYAKVSVNDTQGKFMTVSHETLDNTLQLMWKSLKSRRGSRMILEITTLILIIYFS